MGSSGEGRQENSLRTICSDSQVLYTNTGWSVRMFRVGLHRVHTVAQKTIPMFCYFGKTDLA